jgi:hypothetical protein
LCDGGKVEAMSARRYSIGGVFGGKQRTSRKVGASTDFPKDDERAACNTRESNGTLIFYQSRADYRGAHSITLYVVSPLGDAVTRRYTIDVK